MEDHRIARSLTIKREVIQAQMEPCNEKDAMTKKGRMTVVLRGSRLGGLYRFCTQRI
jgi:hypothetical protein